MVASSSPSYLLLQSLDLCNRYLSDDYPKKLQNCIEKIEKFKLKISRNGFFPEESEPLKIVLHTAKYGYTGDEFCEHLMRFNIIPEFYDKEYLVLMITPENDALDFERLDLAFSHITPKAPLTQIAYLPQKAIVRLSAKKALLSPQELIPIEEASGRICAAPSVSCPPAVPIVISGEEITQNAVELFRLYGIEKVAVVKNFIV